MSISEIGAVLRQARKAKKLTLKQLAQQAGVHFTTLSALERGTIPELGVRKLLRVAETLGLELTLRPYGQRYTLDDLAAERTTIERSVQADPPPLALRLPPTSNKSELESKGGKPADIHRPHVYAAPNSYQGSQTNALAAALSDYNKHSSLSSLGSSANALTAALSDYNKHSSLSSLGSSANALNSLANVTASNPLGSQTNALAAALSDYNKHSSLSSLGNSANALTAQQNEYDKLTSLSKFDSVVNAIRDTDLLTRALGRQTDQTATANTLKSIASLPKKPG